MDRPLQSPEEKKNRFNANPEGLQGIKRKLLYLQPFVAIEVLHGSHIGWQDNENTFHCPAIQCGCRAKPLYRQMAEDRVTFFLCLEVPPDLN